MHNIPLVDKTISDISEAHKNSSDKHRKAFHAYLQEKGLNASYNSVARYTSSVQPNHHLPAYLLAHFCNFYKKIYKDEPDAPNALAPLTLIAREAGYRLVPIELKALTGPIDLIQEIALIQRENSDVISEAANALDDGNLSDIELNKIATEAMELCDVVIRFVSRCLKARDK